MKTVCVLTVLFLLGLYAAAADTNRDNEITTNVTNLIINVSGGQVIIEPDLNLTSGFYWGGLTGFLNNDTVLWANASDQDSRIIVLEGVDNSPFYDNVTQNISQTWGNASAQEAHVGTLYANASNQDGRIIGLEGVKSVYESAKNCPAGQFMNGSNTTNIDCGILNTNFQSVPFWIDSGSLITSNTSINSGNLKIKNITFSDTIMTFYSNFNNANPIIQVRDYLPSFGINELCILPPDGAINKMCFRANNASILPKTVSLTSTTADVLSFIVSVGNVSFVPGGAVPSVLPTGNKAVQLGSSTQSFDNCYCDDHVTTWPDSVSLEENNRGDFGRVTVTSSIDNKGKISYFEKVRFPNSKIEAKIYASYLDALKDIPYYENNGSMGLSVPPMFRDNSGNDDTVSNSAYLSALRGAVFEIEKENKALRVRLDKLEGVRNA